MLKKIIVFFLIIVAKQIVAQPVSFVNYQRGFSRVDNAFKLKEDTLKKQFEKAKINWPPKQIYLRSFKYDSQLEVWVREKITDSFKLFKTYKICALSGAMGPKRMEGDYQVPEGFYHINVFNPQSDFHLSLGISYPNVSDDILSDSTKPGGSIFVHGSCVTVGCIPIKNDNIEELYILATHAKQQGQDIIPIHIFPVKYNVQKSLQYLANTVKDNPDLMNFAVTLQDVHDYFNFYKKIPAIAVNKKGEYVFFK